MTGFMNSWTLQVNYSRHLKGTWMQQVRLLSVQFWWLQQASELIASTEQSDQSLSAPDWFLPLGSDWQYCFFPPCIIQRMTWVDDLPLDQCDPTPCLNGGVCDAGVDGGFVCLCPEPYTGKKCQTGRSVHTCTQICRSYDMILIRIVLAHQDLIFKKNS